MALKKVTRIKGDTFYTYYREETRENPYTEFTYNEDNWLSKKDNLGFHVRSPRDAEYKAYQMKETNHYTINDLKDFGYTGTEMTEANYSLTELKEVGYPASSMKEAGYNITSLKNVGYTATEMKEADYSALQLKM